MLNRRILYGVVGCGLIGAGPAVADPVCMRVDVPGSSWTQGWPINDLNEAVYGADSGGWIRSGGTWRRLPDPPASTGLTAVALTALGLNDAGVIAGAGSTTVDGVEQSFFFADGAYTFFTYPGATRTEVRSLNADGLATVVAYENDVDGSATSGVGLVYNPGGAGAYAPGFTPLAPILDGDDAWFVLPGAMNRAGQVVGTAWFPGRGVWGFRHDPATGATDVFRVAPGPLRARGINDAGVIVGAINGGNGFRGWRRDAGGDHFFDCPELGATGGGIFPESINNGGVISGDMYDADGNGHAFVAFPTVGAAIDDLAAAVAGTGPGKSLAAKVQAIGQDVAAGTAAAACKVLGAFTSEVSAQHGLDAGAAAIFTSEAHAIAVALGC